jgi:AraC-like DNA-binding protein
MREMDELKSLIQRHARPCDIRTSVPGLKLLSATSPGPQTSAVYEPMLVVIAQGSKRTLVGSELYEYSGGQYLVVAVDLPLTVQVTAATKREPYLTLGIDLNPAVLADQILAGKLEPASGGYPKGLDISPLTSGLLNPIVRMLRLLDHPEDIPVLQPLLEREIMWRLLNGAQALTVRQLAVSDSRLSQIGRSIRWLRMHYAQAVRTEDLARLVDMSVPTFNRHFRSITAMSPLQYQKQIRLQEARNRMLATDDDALKVSFEVGYQSPSQFNREYRRLFGAPPRQDVEKLRNLLSANDSEVRSYEDRRGWYTSTSDLPPSPRPFGG